MQQEMGKDYYVIDLLSQDNLMFMKDNISLLDYIKENFPILYKLEMERNNNSDFLMKSVYYGLSRGVLDQLNLPQYIVLYSYNRKDFFDTVTNVMLHSVCNDIETLESKRIFANQKQELSRGYNFVKCLNFFYPLNELKEQAHITKEELIKELSNNEKKYIKSVLKKGMVENDN